MKNLSAFLTLALRGRVAWDVQARHTASYAVRRWLDRRERRLAAKRAERRAAWQILHEAAAEQ